MGFWSDLQFRACVAEPVEQALNPVRKWLVTPVTFMRLLYPWAYLVMPGITAGSAWLVFYSAKLRIRVDGGEGL